VDDLEPRKTTARRGKSGAGVVSRSMPAMDHQQFKGPNRRVISPISHILTASECRNQSDSKPSDLDSSETLNFGGWWMDHHSRECIERNIPRGTKDQEEHRTMR